MIYFQLTRNLKIEGEHLTKDVLISPCFDENQCLRCGFLTTFEDVYCPNCTEFGKLKKSDEWRYLPFELHNLKLVTDSPTLLLTDLQKSASKFIKEQLHKGEDGLIWAVCGAGKTEISFEAIKQVVASGDYVAFAIPRIDILYEIAERIKWYLPDCDVAILNGNEKRIQNAHIYVLTTNQIIKFKDAFKLIVVDEVDAFPYEHNIKYDYGVQMAKRSGGSIIYLTSTPSDNLLDKQLETFCINRRWHGNLLPEPKFSYSLVQVFNYYLVPRKLKKVLKDRKRQLLIFVANIEFGKQVVKVLNLYYDYKIALVYAADPNRRDKLNQFYEKQLDILVTTSILERGVTFPFIDVVILDASSPMYNVAALVQIAGRVNRKKEDQDGTVIFFHQGISENMQKAAEQIAKMNE